MTRLERRIAAADGTPLYARLYPAPDAAAAARLPVVMNDGLGCDGFVWKYLLPDVAATRTVLRWHYRGHGRSAAPEDRATMTIEQLCDDLAVVMDAFEVDRAVHCGHSMGVQVGFEMHRRHPRRVAGLVPICGSYGRPLASFQGSDWGERILPLLGSLVNRHAGEVNAIWRAGFQLTFLPRAAKILEVNEQLCRAEDMIPYFGHLATMDARVFIEMLTHAGEHTAIDHLENVDVPVLIVAGEIDRFTPLELSLEMRRRIAGSEFLPLASGSHVAPLELPEVLFHAIGAFLGRRIDVSSPPRARHAARNRRPE